MHLWAGRPVLGMGESWGEGKAELPERRASVDIHFFYASTWRGEGERKGGWKAKKRKFPLYRTGVVSAPDLKLTPLKLKPLSPLFQKQTSLSLQFLIA